MLSKSADKTVANKHCLRRNAPIREENPSGKSYQLGHISTLGGSQMSS